MKITNLRRPRRICRGSAAGVIAAGLLCLGLAAASQAQQIQPDPTMAKPVPDVDPAMDKRPPGKVAAPDPPRPAFTPGERGHGLAARVRPR